MNSLTTISISDLIYNLDRLPESRNILLLGGHGLGKSQIVTKYYEKKGYKVVPLFLGQMSDPGDITGLPYKREVVLADGTKTERMDFLPPYWWDDSKPFCLFLDEINRGRPEILNVVMDLTLNKTIAGRALPKGSVIVAAANIGDGYTVNDLDKALLDRFVPFEFKPTVDEWLRWADSEELDERVIQFISNNPDFLDGDGQEHDDPMCVTPSRRSWVGVAEALERIGSNLGPNDYKFISGFIGATAVSEFANFISTRQVLTPEDVLLGSFDENVKSQIEKMETVELVRFNDQLKIWFDKEHDADEKKKAAKNTEKYLDFLHDKKRNEVVGHMMAYFGSASSFIVSQPNILAWIDKSIAEYSATLS